MLSLVRITDDEGRPLDAECHIEADGHYLALIMESRSGVSGSRSPRNPDYNRALTTLLSRLGNLRAVLADALVDSQHVHEIGLSEEERQIIQPPVMLAPGVDMDELRRMMGRKQARIGQSPEATKGGNTTKRIRLLLEVPGFELADTLRLEEALATVARSTPQPGTPPEPVSADTAQDAASLLSRLVGTSVTTVTGHRNLVLAMSLRDALVATDRSPQGQPVPISQVQAGLDLMLETGEVEVSVPSLGHRSSFIGAVLLTLPGAALVRTTPPRIRFTAPQTTNPALGTPYRHAEVTEQPGSREPFSVDPALVERGLRGHAGTQNELATVLRNAGIEPRSSQPTEPNFDLAWQHNGIIYVAEVKSITDANEEEQLRLGLGQVLRYRQRLTALRSEGVVAVLVPERDPRDPSWRALCHELGVVLLCRNELERVPDLDPQVPDGETP
jgi:hypothetical protein